jgi:predicted O-methyltransferase YrrM
MPPTETISQSHLTGSPRERLIEDESGITHPSLTHTYAPRQPIPTMLVSRELSYLSWLGSQCGNAGRVIELGCFLGGSTTALLDQLDPRHDLISYDAFQIPSIESERTSKWLAQYGLRPGEQFRDKFDMLTREWSDRIIARQGWLPEYVVGIDPAAIYPEQDPIELLFCDIAKTWGVHLSVLHAFGTHLIPGSTLVHQDFFDLQTPWIPLHMWQLRDVLSPLDVIHGTPTASFRCTHPIAHRLPELLRQDHPTSDLESIWENVIDYWSRYIGKDTAQVFHGHAFKLAVDQGRTTDAIRHGRLYESWSRTRQSANTYFSPCWQDLLMDLIDADHGRSHDLTSLAAESVARGSRSGQQRPGERTSYCDENTRAEVWSTLFREMASRTGATHALYGAGQHTQWLANRFPDEFCRQIAFIIDDEPRTDSILGIPIHPTGLLDHLIKDPTVLYPSSDAYETEMRSRLTLTLSDTHDVTLERAYTRSDFANLTAARWEYHVERIETASPEIHDRAQIHPKLDLYPAHRTTLGLHTHREWLGALEQAFKPPAWCRDYIRKHECAFMWDVLEATRPHRVIEIGTASGVSTAMLLHGIERFSRNDAQVHSYDIGSRCYFDPERPLAAAVAEIAPDLIHRAKTYAGTDASDAASMYAPGDIDLILIDGEHANPAPVIDLLCLAYVVKPGAWVILHDIELHNIQNTETHESMRHSGAGRLFNDWPYEKVQPAGQTPADRNIGAIRLPHTSRETINTLLPMLRAPWESDSKAVLNARAAREILDRSV